MGVYTKLADDIHEVDVIIAGGMSCLSLVYRPIYWLLGDMKLTY